MGSRQKKLVVCHGAGAPHQVDADVLDGLSGSVLEVLRQVARDHIRDPELLATLQGDQVDLDLYSDDDADAAHERPLSASEDWRNVLSELEKSNVEVGVSRHIRGGTPSKRRGNRSRRKKRTTPPQTPPVSFDLKTAGQRVVRHEGEYRLTDTDRVEIEAGNSLFFTGKAIAMANCICQELKWLEILWYWTVRRGNPFLISGIVIPERQSLTGGSCDADGSAVLAASREARKQGRLIVGAGHSHGYSSGYFSSGTDLATMSQLADEKVGFVSKTKVSSPARLRKLDPPANANQEHKPQRSEIFEGTFAEYPGIRLKLTTSRADLSPEQFSAELQQDRRRLVSIFTTHNSAGQCLFPVHKVSWCLLCRSRLEEMTDKDVTLHVLGPVELTDEQRQTILDELREKKTGWRDSRQHSWWCSGQKEDSLGQLSHAGEPTPLARDGVPGNAPNSDSAGAAEPADFQIWRYGQLVGRVPAGVMEEAAHLLPSLATALAWQESKSNDHDGGTSIGCARSTCGSRRSFGTDSKDEGQGRL